MCIYICKKNEILLYSHSKTERKKEVQEKKTAIKVRTEGYVFTDYSSEYWVNTDYNTATG